MRLRGIVWVGMACTLAGACTSPKNEGDLEVSLEPPVVAKKPKQLEMHGDVRTDDYFWLRERDNPAVIAYLDAENAYTEAMMAHTAELQETLYQEIVGRIKQDDDSVPYKDGDFFYYYRYEEGDEYPIYCRKKRSLEAPEEILLDANREAEGHEFFTMWGYEVSPV